MNFIVKIYTTMVTTFYDKNTLQDGTFKFASQDWLSCCPVLFSVCRMCNTLEVALLVATGHLYKQFCSFNSISLPCMKRNLQCSVATIFHSLLDNRDERWVYVNYKKLAGSTVACDIKQDDLTFQFYGWQNDTQFK